MKRSINFRITRNPLAPKRKKNTGIEIPTMFSRGVGPPIASGKTRQTGDPNFARASWSSITMPSKDHEFLGACYRRHINGLCSAVGNAVGQPVFVILRKSTVATKHDIVDLSRI